MATVYSPINPLNSYRSQSVTTLSAGALLVKTYEIALQAVAVKDSGRACKALVQLIDSLDFEYEEISLGLFRLYRYCIEQLKRGEYEVPERILRDLRNTWSQVI